jgi:drug/metabolite transporter (DMT)-like permease
MAGFLWAATAVAIFSGWFAATRFTVTHSLRIWDVIALRFGVGALVLIPAITLPGKRLTSQDWREGFVLASLWGGPFVLLVALGLLLTSAAQASSVTPALMPVFAGLFAWFSLGERPTPSRLLGYAAICIGLTALIASSTSVSQSSRAGGIAALVVAAAMWAVYTIRFRRSRLDALQAAALICVWSALVYLPIYWIAGLSRLSMASTHELCFQIVYQGVFMSVIAAVAYNRAVVRLGPGAAAAIIALVPVSATTIAAGLLNEMPAPLGWAAIVLIAIGVAFAARPHTNADRKETS